MARVFIPISLRPLTSGSKTVKVNGKNVRELIDALDSIYPGIKERLCEQDELRPGLTIAVDGSMSAMKILEPVQPDSEVHFLPAIGGG